MQLRMAPEALARGVGVALALWALAAGVACREPAGRVNVAWTLDPVPPVTGVDTVARVTLLDERHAPVLGARLMIEGYMSHPGMTPVVTAATERGDGVYEARMQFSMAGDWILVVTGGLGDGTRITEQIEVAGVRPAP